jgi:hypothetical protein
MPVAAAAPPRPRAAIRGRPVIYILGALLLAGTALALIVFKVGGSRSLNPDRVGATLFRHFNSTSTGVPLLGWSCSLGGYDPSFNGLGCTPDDNDALPLDAGIPYYKITAVGASCFKATLDNNAAIGGHLVDRAQWGIPDTIRECF